ncbi:MAG: ABC transporter substrate-binding protein [Micropruina sp.]|uniref:taurine ABC transporter substrate-binding protein n=1 Tax=Micropruina sp. TaxID=2737536 RepID=UPI0039E4FCB5
MSNPFTTRVRLAAVACAVALPLALAGCTTAREAEARANAASGSTAQCPIEVNTTATGSVRLGWQAIPGANLVVRDRRWIETCLPNVTVTWIKFDSGADVVQGFGSGSVDLSTLGSSPATKALSAPLNVDMQVVWIDDVIGAAESLVAKKPSVKKLTDLRGGTIAVPFSSTSHFSLLMALQAAGMTPGTDVKLINLSPDKILAAWNGNEVDAAWVWDPVLSELAEHGHVITGSQETAEQGKPTFDLEGATRAFVDANPSFMDTWTALQDHAVSLLTGTDQQSAAQSVAVQLGSTPEAVLTQLKGYTYPRAAAQLDLLAVLPGQLKATAEFLATQGEVDAVSDLSIYRAGIYPTSIEKVAK